MENTAVLVPMGEGMTSKGAIMVLELEVDAALPDEGSWCGGVMVQLLATAPLVQAAAGRLPLASAGGSGGILALAVALRGMSASGAADPESALETSPPSGRPPAGNRGLAGCL